jgi:hypothetical protein
MAALDNVDQLIEQYHLALGEFAKGSPEPVKRLFSQRDDVTLSNLQTSHRGDKRYRDISRYIVIYCQSYRVRLARAHRGMWMARR